MFRIRIVAVSGLHSCLVKQKLEWAATIEFTAEQAIIFFIHC